MIEFHKIDPSSKLELPFADEGIRAGSPNPAQDYMEHVIDLNKELVRNPTATFFGRVRGDSVIDAGLKDGDVLIIDKSLDYMNCDNRIAVCCY